MKLMFLGAPGAGKGTQAERVAATLSLPHISTGDIFRQNIAGQTPLGVKAKTYIDQGQLVPDDITLAMVAERLNQPDCQKGYVLDGFPRTLHQAQALDEKVQLDAVIHIDIAREKLLRRLLGRRVCPKCGKTYHVDLYNSDTCQVCGEQLITRKDDTAETVNNRMAVYDAQTAPLVAYYRQKGVLHDVAGDNGRDEVNQSILDVLQAIS